MTDPGRKAVFTLGGIDPSSRRRILHSTDDVQYLRDAARRSAPVLEKLLNKATSGIKGVGPIHVRPEKDIGRIREKIAQGKPAQTMSDYLAARIVVSSLKSYREVLSSIRTCGFTIIEEDNSLSSGKRNKGGYRAHNFQIVVENGLTAEVQIVPSDIYEVSSQTHALYEKMRSPGVSGEDYIYALQQALALNDAAWERFIERTKPES
jgi:hypothetical protein